MDDARPTTHVTFPTETDVAGRLGRLAVEYVGVNDTRLIAIFQRTIFVVDVTEGRLAAARELAIQLWALPPAGTTAAPPADLLEAFVQSLAPLDAAA